MQEWINQILESGINSWVVFPAVFMFGILGAVSSCCNLSIIGIVVGYSGSLGNIKNKHIVILSGLFFMLGVIASLSILGATTGFVSKVIGNSIGVYWKLVAGIVIIIFGLFALNLIPFKIPKPKIPNKFFPEKILPSLTFGLIVGGLTVACDICCNPAIPVVLSIAFLKSETLWGAAILICFAIGYGAPLTAVLIGLGFGFDKLSRNINKIQPIIKTITGILLITIGFLLIISL